MEANKFKITLKTALIISVFIFIATYYHLTVTCINRYYLEGLIFVLPSALLLTMCIIDTKSNIKKQTLLIALIIIIFSSFCLYFIGLCFIELKDLTTEVSDISEYNRIIKREEGTKLIYQFPKEITEDMKEPKFYYTPKFLQGGM